MHDKPAPNSPPTAHGSIGGADCDGRGPYGDGSDLLIWLYRATPGGRDANPPLLGQSPSQQRLDQPMNAPLSSRKRRSPGLLTGDRGVSTVFQMVDLAGLEPATSRHSVLLPASKQASQSALVGHTQGTNWRTGGGGAGRAPACRSRRGRPATQHEPASKPRAPSAGLSLSPPKSRTRLSTRPQGSSRRRRSR